MPLVERLQPVGVHPETTLIFEETPVPTTITYDLNASLGGAGIVDMYFFDGSGNVVTATGGTVDVLASIGDSPWPFRRLSSGSFGAADAASSTLRLPNSYGGMRRIRVDFNGVTGVSGFRMALMLRTY